MDKCVGDIAKGLREEITMMYEVDVNYEEVARYLGVKDGKLDLDMRQEIQNATMQLREYVDYKFQYKVLDIDKNEHRMKLMNTNLRLEGKTIGKLLEDCNQCIILAVTLGQRVDAMLRTLQVTNLSQAVVLDFCASSMIEQLCNQVEDSLRNDWKNKNLYLTDRFSPGYGDMSLEVQKQFCEVLDTSRRMGLHVTSSGLMVPRKSITAMIGIASKEQKMRIKGCKYCNFYKDCEYRKGGRICD